MRHRKPGDLVSLKKNTDKCNKKQACFMIINIINMHSFGDIYEFYVFLVKNVLQIYDNYLKTYIALPAEIKSN